MKITLLQISSPHGTATSAYKNIQVCRKYLFDYVREWWDTELELVSAIPDDAELAIEQYFEDVIEEGYQIEELEVLED